MEAEEISELLAFSSTLTRLLAEKILAQNYFGSNIVR